jgi:Tfp pilus assembly protein PilN
VIAYVIAGVCAVGLVAIWFVTVRKELSERRRDLISLRKQLLMHEEASAQIREGPEKEIAVRMRETNRKVYQEADRNYNRILRKPKNRLPALLTRFHSVDESGNIDEGNE